MDFFPTVDAGSFGCTSRCPDGTRLEESARRFADVEDVIHQTIPARDRHRARQHRPSTGGINLAFSDGRW